MAVKRIKATKDTTITNAYKANLSSRGSGSNMGASDILEVFSIYAQASTSSSELSRVLIDFDIASLSSSRDDGDIPGSGSVDFYLRLFNAEHSSTTATDYTMLISAVSQSWDEGTGLDMEDYSDPGIGNGGQGATWAARKSGSFSAGSLNLDRAGTEFVSVAADDTFTFSNSTALIVGIQDDPFSISAWIYVDSLPFPVVTKFDATTADKREWNFLVASNGSISFEVYDENANKSASITSATSAVTTGQWYHLVATYDGRGNSTTTPHGGMKFYKDGVEVSQSAATTAAGYVAMQFTGQLPWIGKIDNGSALYADGQVDEVSVWSKELASYDVKEIYNEAVPNNLKKTTAYEVDDTNKLMSWWKMEWDQVIPKDTATTIYDRSNTYDGTGQNLDSADLLTSNYAGINKDNETNTGLYWVDEGGTFITGSSYNPSLYTQKFTTGVEDLEVEVTHQVEEWLNPHTTASYGFGVFLSGSYETKENSYYTKKFFGRDSQYVLKRPVLEARWDSSKQDDTSNFYLSSSRVPAAENLNTIYMYNFVRGQLKNLPNIHTVGTADRDDGIIYVSIYSGTADGTGPTGNKLQLPLGGGVADTNHTNITGGYASSTGIYSASFAYNNKTVTSIYPVWHSGAGGNQDTEYLTSSAITVNTFDEQVIYPINTYTTSITNLQAQYSTNDQAHFRVFVRNRDWNPNIYTVASTKIESAIIPKIYYKVIRAVDEQIVINYGTGSGDQGYTKLSYDASGSYFDLDMSIYETDFSYQVGFLINEGSDYVELKDKFNFRVVDENDIPG